MTVRVLHGDCLDVMPTLEPESVDAIVTDPPYGLGFMGKDWDHGVPGVHFWTEALRVAKPGAHLVAFGGTRTYHRLTCAIEDAGWEIRDGIGYAHDVADELRAMWADLTDEERRAAAVLVQHLTGGGGPLAWVYGSGFPKSLDVSKAIDKAAGAEREIVSTVPDRWAGKGNVLQRSTQDARAEAHITAPSTDLARQWEGWGTALKPAWEPIILARKPLVGTVAANVTVHGTGALNIEGCRINPGEPVRDGGGLRGGAASRHEGWQRSSHAGGLASEPLLEPRACFSDARPSGDHDRGRWPANVVLDEEAARLLDEQSGESVSRVGKPRGAAAGAGWGMTATGAEYTDAGGASRFFYTAKASRSEREAGLSAMPRKFAPTMGNGIGGKEHDPDTATRKGNVHPTVKPVDLMRWLCRLVTPPKGLILDPFTGSGSTGCAAALEGFGFVGIEREEEYVAIARARIAHHEALYQPSIFGGAA